MKTSSYAKAKGFFHAHEAWGHLPATSGNDGLAANNDPALGEVEFFADLGHQVPLPLQDGRCDELRADVRFGE